MMDALPNHWRRPLVQFVVALAAILVIFHRDAVDMAVIWWNASTYNHCLMILPLVGWLVWQRRRELAPLEPQAFAPGLVLVGCGSFAWLLGDAAGIALFRHAGLVFIIQSSVLILLGRDVVRGLLYPLFYLVFLVPFGEELVPPLQTLTAKLSMAMLGWAGIPAHIEGVFIQTPSGLFEVAEACSGVKFLVAMVAYGALVAHVCFKSWLRRIAFMAVCVLVPILANGVRAYGIMHISFLTSSDFAASVDHLIWGWIFFALVMALVMALGWRLFDRGIDDPWLDGWTGSSTSPRTRATPLLALMTLCVVIAPVAWGQVATRLGREAVTKSVKLPAIPGWTKVALDQPWPWQPKFNGADHRLLGAYRDGKGRTVELAVAIYGWQEEGRELVGFGQGAAPDGSRWSWANNTQPPKGGKAERIFAPEAQREVASFYHLGGVTTGSDLTVKLQTLKTRLLGGDQAAVAIMIAADSDSEGSGRIAIDAFLAALGSPATLAEALVAQARGR